MVQIVPAGPSQAGDYFRARVHDPVFRNAGGGVILPLGFQVSTAAARVLAHDFDDQIRAVPVFLANPPCVRLQHEDQIGLAKPTWTDLHRQRGYE